ncbi:MAG: MurR/RpiR family transcriptional regulator [Culicoidibacterales bacterium]
MENVLTNLIALLDKSDHQNKTDAQIAWAIWEHLQKNEPLRIETLGEQTHLSPATMNRFAKRLGYSGFLPLKKSLIRAWEANRQQEIRMSRVAYNYFADDHHEIMAYNFDLVRQGLIQTQKILPLESLEQVVRLFGVANTIHFVGIDYSHLVAKDAQQKFIRLGKMCTAYRDLDYYREEDTFQQGDVVVIFSFSGQTIINEQVAMAAKEKNLQIIAITSDVMSPIAQTATHIIPIAGQENAFSDSSTSGRIILHTVMDAMYLLYGTINNKNLVITE